MVKKVKEIVINREWCKGCGICIHFCPKKVLRLDKDNKAVVADLDSCIGCKFCESRCPELAIEIKFLNNNEELRIYGRKNKICTGERSLR